MANTRAKLTYEARVWEKAEHWHFDATIKAVDERAARVQLQKLYPARRYSVGEIRRCWSVAE